MILTRKNWQALCKKNLIWNHVNNSRDNYFASSRDVKADMIRKFYSEMVRQCKIFYIFIFYIYNSFSVIGCKVARKGDYIHMAFVFHKITSCTECATCGYCVNCDGLNKLELEFEKHKFYGKNSNIKRWWVYFIMKKG